MRSTTWSACLAVALATGAGAQPLPVDVLFCNIDCQSAAADASCRIGIVGGNALEAERRDIVPLAGGDGVEIGGELAMPTGDGGEVLLAEAAVTLRFSQPGPAACLIGFDLVRGTARLPVPGVGHLAAASIEVIEQPMASIGLELGRHLIADDSPWCLPEFGIDCDCTDFCIDEAPILRSDAHYFAFDVDARYVFAIAGIELPSSPGVEATLVFDTSDPYFFLTGSVLNIPGLPTPLSASSGGFGFSWSDEIPFVPLSTYPFGDVMEPFQGGYAARVKLPIFQTEFERVKVLLDGMLIGSLDPDQDGDHPFLTPDEFGDDPDLALGGNGAFSVRFSPFKKSVAKKKGKAGKEEKPTTDKDVQKEGKKAKKTGVANSLLAMEFDIGAASALTRVHPTFSELFLSGTLGDQQSLLPAWMPLPVRGGAGTKLAAYFSTVAEDSFVQAEGGFAIDTTVLASWAKLAPLGAVNTTEGFLRADQTGFLIGGRTQNQMHPLIAPTGEVGVEAFVAPNGIDSRLTLSGAMQVGDDVYPDAELTLSPSGLAVSGTLSFAQHDFAMTGLFTNTSGTLTGSTEIDTFYSPANVARAAELADAILNKSLEVKAGEILLDAAEGELEKARETFEAASSILAAAIAAVNTVQDQIDAADVALAQLLSDLNFQANVRNCNADYTGCPSCGSCSSRCNCNFGDFICAADCAACNVALAACTTARETCRVANIAVCEADRAARIVALGAQIAGKEAEKLVLIAAKDVALGALGLAQSAVNTALSVVATAEATAEAAQTGLAAARAGLALLQQQLANLPAVKGEVTAVASIDITTSAAGTQKTGRLSATFQGQRIARGRIDLDAHPPLACLTVPTLGELCAPL